MTGVTTRGPRKDQVRNRQRLLDVARVAFGERGPDTSIEAIARIAGVGATTFYRNFPTKDDLVFELLDDLAASARAVAAEAGEIADDWEAFELVFTRGCVLDDASLKVFDVLCRTSHQAAEHGRTITASLVGPAVDRAQRARRLREDVSVEDVAAFMRMADSAETAERRRKAQTVLLAGLRSGAGSGVAPRSST
jgi:AcrR family transcriptional regulator